MVSDVAITTKTEKDDVSMTYTVNHTGDVTSSKPSHLGQGNQIHVSIVLVQSNFSFRFGFIIQFSPLQSMDDEAEAEPKIAVDNYYH